ncbi:MAG TPA: TolC family protein [Acidobacteriota bacterium]|nr:TolC family protein [Acidobacteriota bacterium]
MTRHRIFGIIFFLLAGLPSAWAQSIPDLYLPQNIQNPFLGSSVNQKPSDTPIDLSLLSAIDLGLKYNLGLQLSEEQARAARGVRMESLSDLLPHVRAGFSESVQQISLAAFGFPPNQQFPEILGPFSVFDMRSYVSQTIFDLHAIRQTNADTLAQKAADYGTRDARELVVLIIANLYLQAVTGESRVEAAQSQFNTAQSLYNQAADMKSAGLIPAVDVLRAQVEMESRRQQLIRFQNEREKQKLALARAIGLPLGQKIRLTDAIRPTPVPPYTLDQALKLAYENRGDYLEAVAQMQSAESARKAAQGKYYPSAVMQADFGDIGTNPGGAQVTFGVMGALKIPIFEGGKTQGEVLKADAALQQKKARLEDLHVLIEQQVRASFLDLTATGERVTVAQKALDLAQQEMEQAQDRFSAGVANNLEVVEAQESLANAHEDYISSLFENSMAKATLVRSMGRAESTIKTFLGEQP